jgi:hypothetical protein
MVPALQIDGILDDGDVEPTRPDYVGSAVSSAIGDQQVGRVLEDRIFRSDE